MMRRLAALVPQRYARLAGRFALPIAAIAGLLALFLILGAVSIVSPGSVGITAARLTETTSLPDALLDGNLAALDTDRDGVSDSLENYLYGSDPANWDSSGTGIPDGWLAQHGYDPSDPLLTERRGKGPDPLTLPAAYRKGYPLEYTPLLSAYYAYGKPVDYEPGQDAPWWREGKHADPSVADQARTGVPTGWLLHYGLDVEKAQVDRVAPGSQGNLTIREAFTHNTNPLRADTDGDGLDDWTEIHVTLTDPAAFSTSGTSIADGWMIHFGLNPFDAQAASQDTDLDGLTHREEFLYSYDALRAEIERDGLQVLHTRGLHPLEWETAGTGIPDGWYVKYGLSPFGADVDRVIARASEFAEARDLDSAPEGFEPKPDFVMTLRDAYTYGRPADWNETLQGVWWGGTNPETGDTDEDGLPDAVEIRGWYASATFDAGPEAKPRVYNATSNPLEADSDGDGLKDLDEYRGTTTCVRAGGANALREFPTTDPRNRDTAFSGLTDLEKVCGIARGTSFYDPNALEGALKLDPTKADSAGDSLRDGEALDFWHKRATALAADPSYRALYPGSSYATLYDWTRTYARFRDATDAEILTQFRPDGDVDGDGVANMLDPDPAGGLHAERFAEPGAPRNKVHFLGGPQIQPALYRFTEFASEVPHAESDPANPDTDGDGLPDSWETRYGVFDAARGGWNLDPSKADSDGDEITDAEANNDGDSIVWYAYTRRGTATERIAQTFVFNNLLEYAAGTHPNEVSTSGDGISDAWKAFWGSRVSPETYPSLVAARDGRIGEVALGQVGAIEATIGESPIQPLADLRDKGHKTLGVYRFVGGLENCDGLEEKLAPYITGDDVIIPGGCYGQEHLSETKGAIGTLGSVSTLTYRREMELRTNPHMADTDGDGSPDAYESYYMVRNPGGTNYPDPVVADSQREKDPDGDLAGHEQECASSDGGRTCGLRGLRPDNLADDTPCGTLEEGCHGAGARPVPDATDLKETGKDTDKDGIEDGVELAAGLNPLKTSDVGPFLQGDLDSDGDGVLDYEELTGWGKAEFGENIRTDPQDPDTDGDGALDGPNRRLVYRVPASGERANTPAEAATNARIESWCTRGLAHHVVVNGTLAPIRESEICGPGMATRITRSLRYDFVGERTFGTAFGIRPDRLDSSGTGVPDGWLAYHNENPQERTIDATAYALHRPSWWEERTHGVWWWGASSTQDPTNDGDADGLHDSNGEDPLPTLRLNLIPDATARLDDAGRIQTWVLDAANATQARERAQRTGDGAGDPLSARAAHRAALDGNGIPTRNDRAKVAILDLEVPGNVTKGVPFLVTGRVVLDERSGGTLLEGSETQRIGLANRTVLLSLFRADPDTVVGATFTDPEGRFATNVTLSDTYTATIPYDGIALLGRLSGTVVENVDPSLANAGRVTAGVRNSLVAWVTNTSATVPAGHPTHATHRALLTQENGALLDTTTVATGFAATAPVPIDIYSTTRFTTTVAPEILNGGMLIGDLHLVDASGNPIPNVPVTLTWKGSASPVTPPPFQTDRNGLLNITDRKFAASVLEAGSYGLSARYTSADPYLASVDHEFPIAIKNPTSLTGTLSTTALVVDAEVLVTGQLERVSLRLPDGRTTERESIAGATIQIRLGGLEATARTDARGQYQARIVVPSGLSAGAQSLLVRYDGSDLDGKAEALLPVSVKRTSILTGLNTLEGPRTLDATLRGRLIDNTGQGFAGPIEAYGPTGGRLARGNATAEGHFALPIRLSLLTLGPQSVRVAYAGDETHAPAENLTNARVTSSTRIELDAPNTITRGETIHLSGRLLDDRNEPVPRQALLLTWRGEPLTHVVTDASGLFTHDIPTNLTERPGITAAGAQYVPPTASVLSGATSDRTLRVVAGTLLTLDEATVHRGTIAFTGRLVDDEGRPLAASLIQITLDGQPAAQGRTARNGTYAIEHVLPDGTPLGAHAMSAHFAGADRHANATDDATLLVQSVLDVRIATLGPFIRGESAPIDGRVLDDRGAGVDLPLALLLDGENAGTARAVDGALATRITLPNTITRGDHVLTLRWAGDDRYPAFERTYDITVKVRPTVDVDLPAVAIRGFAFGGAVHLTDDRGEPLRNTTFLYALGPNGEPLVATTDDDGQARIASVAPLSGNTALSLRIRGADDLVAAEYETKTLNVIGPSTPVGYASLILLVLVLVIVVTLVVLAIVYRRRQLVEVREILEEAIQDLIAGNEYAGTIFLAYKRLASHVARHGFAERAHDTPREFAAGIRKAIPVGAESLREVIRLFEEARYSDHAIGSHERDVAIENLARVRNEIDVVLGASKPQAVGA